MSPSHGRPHVHKDKYQKISPAVHCHVQLFNKKEKDIKTLIFYICIWSLWVFFFKLEKWEKKNHLLPLCKRDPARVATPGALPDPNPLIVSCPGTHQQSWVLFLKFWECKKQTKKCFKVIFSCGLNYPDTHLLSFNTLAALKNRNRCPSKNVIILHPFLGDVARNSSSIHYSTLGPPLGRRDPCKCFSDSQK